MKTEVEYHWHRKIYLYHANLDSAFIAFSFTWLILQYFLSKVKCRFGSLLFISKIYYFSSFSLLNILKTSINLMLSGENLNYCFTIWIH